MPIGQKEQIDSMRIIAGTARGRSIVAPAGSKTRPTQDYVRESLFNIIRWDVQDARVLDLFAGSGALGLESLSRGAAEVVFNDKSKDSLAILKKNLRALKIEEGKEAKIYNLDAEAYLGYERHPFDIIFIDPPYAMACCAEALRRLLRDKLSDARYLERSLLDGLAEHLEAFAAYLLESEFHYSGTAYSYVYYGISLGMLGLSKRAFFVKEDIVVLALS